MSFDPLNKQDDVLAKKYETPEERKEALYKRYKEIIRHPKLTTVMMDEWLKIKKELDDNIKNKRSGKL